ncbi:hypothetical protein HHI36_017260 [Cryptolaemus montrouzieri]|uniref:BESS domain-containing protein n=1 Tax=Cryptolaemus montrouzieri TaxID=559131 RepID=A0ABD2NMU0_9CUCU
MFLSESKIYGHIIFRATDSKSDNHDNHEDDAREEEMSPSDDNSTQSNNIASSAPLKPSHFVAEVTPYDADSVSEPKEGSSTIRLVQQIKRENLGNVIETDPVHAFFHSMALTVKRLPPELIAEARLQICEIVGMLEIKALGLDEQQEHHPNKKLNLNMKKCLKLQNLILACELINLTANGYF